VTLLRHLKIGAIALALSLNVNAATAEVVAVVSTKSPVTSLSDNQVVDIFLGRVNRLPNGEPVRPVDQAEDSPVRNEFYAKFTGKSAAQVKAHWSKVIFTGRGNPPKEIGNNDEVKKFLTANPNAIGYIDAAAVDESVRVLKAR
jgi:ABC-type phosphate transport system substrate-binding protein